MQVSQMHCVSKPLLALATWGLRSQRHQECVCAWGWHRTSGKRGREWSRTYCDQAGAVLSACATEGSEANTALEDFDEVFEDVEAGLPPEVAPSAFIDAGDASWGSAALKCAESVLSRPQMTNLSLFSFSAISSIKKINIRLDKLTDRYGSPGLEEIQCFSEQLTSELEGELGEEEAGTIELEVSSPGAEREVRVPEELVRFKDLPMKVIFTSETDAEQTEILMFSDTSKTSDDCEATEWHLADTKLGRKTRKGRPLSRKLREKVIRIPVQNLHQVSLYLDA